MKWSLFILDFDDTYDCEQEDNYGVKPDVYLIPTKMLKDVHSYAKYAHDDFHSDDNGNMGIGDYFESYMKNNGIDYKRVGEIDLTFEERWGDYLSNDIEMEVV